MIRAGNIKSQAARYLLRVIFQKLVLTGSIFFPVFSVRTESCCSISCFPYLELEGRIYSPGEWSDFSPTTLLLLLNSIRNRLGFWQVRQRGEAACPYIVG